jgi:hypothetical protein
MWIGLMWPIICTGDGCYIDGDNFLSWMEGGEFLDFSSVNFS